MKLYRIRDCQFHLAGIALLWLFVGQAAFAATKPSITTGPASAAKCPGDTVSFSVVAAGATPLKYQWLKNGSAISGATATAFSLSPISAANAGSYTVTVSNSVGTATSAAAILSVNTPVSTSALTNLMRSVGANAVFSTVASGTGPFSYVWDKDGAVLSGKTSSSLTLTNLGIAASGVYRVTVSGACGSASASATLTVDSCFPSLDVMLVIDRTGSMLGQKYADAKLAASNFVANLNFSLNADQGGLASFNTTGTLDQPLTNSLAALHRAIGALPAASGNTAISQGLLVGQSGLVSSRHNPLALPVMILLSDGLPTGTDTKSNALYLATQAKNAGTLLFTVGLGSDVDPALMAGIASSSSNYFFASDSSEINGLFNKIATLICRPPTNIYVSGLSNLTVCAGSDATFAATVTAGSADCAPYGYQWRKDGNLLAGQTNSSLVIRNASVADAGVYGLVVTSVCRTVTNNVTLMVNSPVQIVSGPPSITNCPGTTAAFSVAATGTSLSCQWYKGASALAGQVGTSLQLSNVSPADAGIYGVVVSGICGSGVTNLATLTVASPAVVSVPPSDVIACRGTSARFDVMASGLGLTYQWLKGGSALPSQTASSLVLAAVSASDAGRYSVVVNGTCGGAATNSANLTVNENVVVVTGPMNLTNCPGSAAGFSVGATGTGLSYQWYKGGSLSSASISVSAANAVAARPSSNAAAKANASR